MASKITISEIGRQLAQRLLASFWFSAPGLIRIRIWVYGRLFNAGRGCSYGHQVIFERHHGLPGDIKIGDHVQIAHDVIVDCSGSVTIGDHVWISEEAILMTHSHEFSGRRLKVEADNIVAGSLAIGRDAWIGSRVIILPQVGSIGEGAIIGAGSVVTKPVAPFDIVAGNPARVIGSRSDH